MATDTAPSKCINDGDDLNFFLTSTAYRDIKSWLFQLNHACFPVKSQDGSTSICRLDEPPTFSPTIESLRSMLQAFSDLLEQAPPDTGPRRFGNVAFRTWYKLAEHNADELLERHLASTLRAHVDMQDELRAYLLGSFGSAQRLDYGTGHELSFLAFLGCLSKLGAFAAGEERAIVVGVFESYLRLIRDIIMTYTLEPAGSHGVWGLDDHSFLPYVFGAAQLGPPISPGQPTPVQGSLDTAPEPDTITSKPTVAEYMKSNMYYSAIQFIYDVKKGPFWEHSPILFNVSGIKDGWGKINKGMLKMYDAEVLGKFPVVQHFPFGKLFRWEQDREAVRRQTTVHAQQQPASSRPAEGAGVAAPWANQAAGAQGMESMRAPWANAGQSGGNAGMVPTAAPWASAPGARMQPSGPPGRPIGLQNPSTYRRMPPPSSGPGTGGRR